MTTCDFCWHKTNRPTFPLTSEFGRTYNICDHCALDHKLITREEWLVLISS